ncbi:MAG: hypothetical protein K5694_07250 [Bacilli bacterium]|nr:hypothetical protein [Bacilli bacterium]
MAVVVPVFRNSYDLSQFINFDALDLDKLAENANIYKDGRPFTKKEFLEAAEILSKSFADHFNVLVEDKDFKTLMVFKNSARPVISPKSKMPMSMLKSPRPRTDEAGLPTYLNSSKGDFTFVDVLFSILEKHSLSDVEAYTSSNLDRRLFSKLRSEAYHPSKKTIFALCIGCRLTLEESDKLLEYAGYCFSPAYAFDRLVKQLIISKKYRSIHEVNLILLEKDLPLLGSVD